MKFPTLYLFFSLAGFLFVSTGCPSVSYTDPDSNITTVIEFEAELINNNEFVAGATYENTITFDLREQMEERYGISLDNNELISFDVDKVAVFLGNTEGCRKLASLSYAFNLPRIEPYAESYTAAGLDEVCDQPRLAEIESGHPVFETNFAPSIENGENMTLEIAMAADETIEPGFAFGFVLNTTITYRPVE